MCGILGVVSSERLKEGEFEEALAKLSRRGPNGSNSKTFFHNDDQITFGHTRLAIIDLSSGGTQPMSMRRDQLIVIFNGEIYNYKKLRSELENKGHKFESSSDTEVLLHCYDEYGEDCVNHLDGMFAFGIYDLKRGSIFLARDPFGKKPLYYKESGSSFVFGSEISAIRKLRGIDKSLLVSETSVLQYFVFGFVPGPNSIFSEIKKLPPGSTAHYDLKARKLVGLKKFWNPLEPEKRIQWDNETELLEQIDQLLTKSVESRLVADVPICMFLSGGVDSSIVLAKAKELGASINAFSTTFEGYRADESSHAKAVANHLGVSLELVSMNNDNLTTAAMEMLEYLDEPIADAAMLPLYHLSKHVSRSFRVALCGDGGDEIFGGYIKYNVQKKIEQLGVIRHALGLAKDLEFLPDNLRRLAFGMSLEFQKRQFIFGSGGFLPNELGKLLDVDPAEFDKMYNEFNFLHQQILGQDPVNRSLLMDCEFQLPDWYLVKSDRASMANGLELRSPLLDRSLAKTMFQLPGSLKIQQGELKYLLKKIAAKYLPHETIYRPKLGFSVDIDSWVRSSSFKRLVFEKNEKVPINRNWLETNYSRLSPLKLMRIAFFNFFCRTVA